MEPSGEVVSALNMACLSPLPVIRLLPRPRLMARRSLFILARIAFADELPGFPSSNSAEMRPKLCSSLQAFELGLAVHL